MSAAELTLPRLLLDPAGAVISPCARYRYWLHRFWLHGSGVAVFVMLNPSTADARHDDPTIRRCISFAKAWGHRGLVVVNLFAARSTNPDALSDFEGDPEGPENHAYVTLACELAAQHEPETATATGKVVCGWGAHWMARVQVPTMLGWIEAARAAPLCLGRTKDGAPRHPLYIKSATPLEPFDLRRAA